MEMRRALVKSGGEGEAFVADLGLHRLLVDVHGDKDLVGAVPAK